MKEKIRELLINIRNLKYPSNEFKSIEEFKAKLSSDLNLNTQDALEVLGYLIKGDYIKIYEDSGIVLNPSNKKLRELIESGII
jgi:hypothetical protein